MRFGNSSGWKAVLFEGLKFLPRNLSRAIYAFGNENAVTGTALACPECAGTKRVFS
jgi:hypothetical protein